MANNNDDTDNGDNGNDDDKHFDDQQQSMNVRALARRIFNLSASLDRFEQKGKRRDEIIAQLRKELEDVVKNKLALLSDNDLKSLNAIIKGYEFRSTAWSMIVKFGGYALFVVAVVGMLRGTISFNNFIHFLIK